MADCSKCRRVDVKCCFTCKKDSDKCQVWHHCGSDCPEHESRIKTNADKIRSMNDEECIVSFGDAYVHDSKDSILDWLQSEAEQQKGELWQTKD